MLASKKGPEPLHRERVCARTSALSSDGALASSALLLLDHHPRTGELRGVSPRTCGCGRYSLARRDHYR
jgi:hypothetical protein